MGTEYNVLAWSQSSGSHVTHVDTATADSPREAVQIAVDDDIELQSLDDDEPLSGSAHGYHAIPVDAYHSFREIDR